MATEDFEQRKREWYERVKKEGKLNRDPKEEHDAKLKTLQNPVRRDIIKNLYEKKMTFDELKSEFNLENMPLKLHLGMLEDTLYIEKEDEKTYVITPRGEEYLATLDSKDDSKDDLMKRRDEWYEKAKKEAQEESHRGP